MKKLKLNLQSTSGVEVLSREELKKVAGGAMGSHQGCTSDSDCWGVDPDAICFFGTCNVRNAGSNGGTNCMDVPHYQQCHGNTYGCCPSYSALGCMYQGGSYSCI